MGVFSRFLNCTNGTKSRNAPHLLLHNTYCFLLTHIVNYEKTVFDKKKFEKCDMTSVNLEKTLEYIKIRESLRFENLIKYYLCEGILLYVFLCLEKYYISTK